MHRVPVAILGGSGYTAVELIKILLRHPGAEIAAITSRQDAGTPVSQMHPVLAKRCDQPLEPFDAKALAARGIKVAFGCLPHGASMEAIPALLDEGIRVIDLSADYRLRDPSEYEAWYHAPHQDIANLAHAVYGLPELHRDAIRTARLVANPGCYPQTAILALAPLVRESIARSGIIIDSKSGVSGAGRTPKLTTHFPECNESVSAYGIGTHRHTPEIEQALRQVAGAPVSVIFTPHLMPMDRGIFSTIYAAPSKPLTVPELNAIYDRSYAAEPFVRVKATPPSTKDTAHTNYLDLYPTIVRGMVLVLAAEDNLIRGASGVAVQNFNLMMGFDETTALA
jgi:N-acetyl-gamma-glutamyl-phosphate reductase